MSFFFFNKTDNIINAQILNKDVLNKEILSYMSRIDSDIESYSNIYNNKFYMMVFERMLLSEVKRNMVLKKNIPYILKINMDDNLLIYSVVNIDYKDIDKGYTIDMTLQG